MNQPDINAVKEYLLSSQDSTCNGLAAVDGEEIFREDCWELDATRVLTGGAVFERGGINFSHVYGEVGTR